MITDGQELVEAVIAALPGPTVNRPFYYEITGAIVGWPVEGVITVELRSRCRFGRGETGVRHDCTIDLDDHMVGGKAPKGITAALKAALEKIDGPRSISG